MLIYLIHKSQIEGGALSSLLQKEGFQVVHRRDLRVNYFDENPLFLLDVNSISQSNKCRISKILKTCNSIAMIGNLSQIHWFFEFSNSYRAFICKKEGTDQLLSTVKRLDDKQTILSPKTSDFLFKTPIAQQEHLFEHSLNHHLTQTELKIMWEIAQGHTARQIAEARHRSKHTIYNHRKNIMNKLELNGTFRLTKFCYNKADSIRTLVTLNIHNKFIEKLGAE